MARAAAIHLCVSVSARYAIWDRVASAPMLTPRTVVLPYANDAEAVAGDVAGAFAGVLGLTAGAGAFALIAGDLTGCLTAAGALATWAALLARSKSRSLRASVEEARARMVQQRMRAKRRMRDLRERIVWVNERDGRKGSLYCSLRGMPELRRGRRTLR